MSACRRQPLTLAELLSRVVLTVPEYAATFDVDERTARRAIREGQLHALRIGDTWRIPVAPLLQKCGLADADPTGIDLANSEAAPASTATRSDHRPLKAIRHDNFDPPAA
jgi:excisionase family DNA binding protein